MKESTVRNNKTLQARSVAHLTQILNMFQTFNFDLYSLMGEEKESWQLYFLSVCLFMCLCVCVCVRACVRACAFIVSIDFSSRRFLKMNSPDWAADQIKS